MEALLEREADVESWNDERMDELSRRMDAGFERAATKEEMNRRFDEVDVRFSRLEAGMQSQFGRLNDRLDKFTFAIVGILGTFAAATAAAIIGSLMS